MRRFALLLGVSAVTVLAGACAHRGLPGTARQRVEFTPVPEDAAAKVTNPHDFNGGTLCQRCHVRGEDRPSVDPLGLCAQCHDANRMKHPFGMEYTRGAGPLPLLNGREVACHTCHDPHDVKKFPHGLRAEYTKLCLECHKRH
jgi:predicted CXXCH cytochrome family protein